MYRVKISAIRPKITIMFTWKPGILFFVLLFTIKSYSQVNLQTGSATFSVPMFNWQDDKSRLNSVVALSYSSGNGLKVSDVASSAGQGWNMIAGGVVTRMQVGEPDDQVARNGNGTESDISKYPAGILFATVPAANGCPDALRKYPIYGWKNQVYAQHNVIAEDKQLDYFSFQFNGKAGMFVLDPSNPGIARSLGDTKMIINFQQDVNLVSQGIRTVITSFTIKDVDGLIYKFARHGLTKVLQAGFCDASLNYKYTQPKFKGDEVYHQTGFESAEIVNPWIIGSWYLTEIEDALTHRKVLFNYTTRNMNGIAGQDIMYNADKNYTIISHKKSITQSPAITSITYPDGHAAVFNYGADRFDMPGDKILTSVDFTFQGRYLSKYLLNTSYFILNRYGSPTTDYQRKVARLCLRSVQKIGVDLKEDSPPYIFDYYLGSNAVDDFVPPPFFYAKDIWGFYNGSNSKGFWLEDIQLHRPITGLSNNELRGLCYSREGVSGILLNPKTNYAQNGLLKQIIYPTGGTLTYQYQQNTGILNQVSREVGGVHVSQTSSTDGGYSNNCSNPLTTSYNYVLDGGGNVSSLWGLEMPVNFMSAHSHYQPELRTYKYKLSCFPLGCCVWKFQYPGILNLQQAISLSDFQKIMGMAGPILGIVSAVSTVIDVVNLCISATPLNIIAVVLDFIGSVITFALTCFGDQAKDTYTTTYYNSDLNAVAPLPTQFKRVEVIENPGTIGKTIQEFTSNDDYAIWELTNPNFAAKQRFAPWAYGLPKKTIIKDNQGYKVKETENFYTFSETSCNTFFSGEGEGAVPCSTLVRQPIYISSCKCLVTKSTSQRSTEWTDPNIYTASTSYLTSSNPDMKVDIYKMYTGRVLLKSTLERTFKPQSNTEYLETKIEYNYFSGNYEVNRVKIYQSNGDITIKDIRYPANYSAAIITTLLQNNIISIPIETTTSVQKGTNLSYLGEEVTEFTTLANGDIKPYRTLEQRFALPVSSTAMTFYQGPGSSVTNYKITQQFSYDGSGNLIGMKDEGSRTIANLYGYDQKYVVASVINADAINDKYAYAGFEDVSSNWLGWTLQISSGTAAYVNTGVTGARSFSVTPYTTFVSTVSTSKPHVISFWATAAVNVTATGGTATQTKSAPVVNGYTYYEYDISQGTSSVSVGATTSTMDELRLYPKTARMRTVSYDPAIGKTSECDENNRITYYTYDNMGRLQFIKDENRNIIKMYEYNNISPAKQNGCPGTYYNKLVSEVFIKNNCGAGYIGGTVIYTVPANTYSSVLSQQDADIQAENYLLANGQAYANSNGTCTQVYYNVLRSQTFTKENCPIGYSGGTFTYTVPAGRYSSILNQAAADALADAEIAANGQAAANTNNTSNCVIDTDPIWEWLPGSPYYCKLVGGVWHLFVFMTNINPNSSTYNQTQWSDVGESELCQSGVYYNSLQSQSFTRNNCSPGYTGSSVTYTVAASTYASPVSLAAANQLALDDIAANGQNYANVNGTCTPVSGCSSCNGAAQACINNVCETGTPGVVSSVYMKVLVDGFLQWRWVCTYRYCFSDGSQSTTSWQVIGTSSCPLTCLTPL